MINLNIRQLSGLTGFSGSFHGGIACCYLTAAGAGLGKANLMKSYLIGLLAASSAGVVQAAEAPSYTVEIGASGQISLSGNELSLEQLTEKLKGFSSSDKDVRVLIAASEHAPLDRVAKVMDACRSAGITKIVLQSK